MLKDNFTNQYKFRQLGGRSTGDQPLHSEETANKVYIYQEITEIKTDLFYEEGEEEEEEKNDDLPVLPSLSDWLVAADSYYDDFYKNKYNNIIEEIENNIKKNPDAKQIFELPDEICREFCNKESNEETKTRKIQENLLP